MNVQMEEWKQDAETTDFRFVETKDKKGMIVVGYRDGAACDVVEIPATYQGRPVTEIGDHAFVSKTGRCQTFRKLTMPDTIVSIGDFAFMKCSRMESIVLSENLRHIGRQAFQYCNGLREIRIPASLETLGERAFQGSTAGTLENIFVEKANRFFQDRDGVLYSKDGQTLLSYPTGRKAETYAIPAGTKRIAEDAFRADHVRKNTMALRQVIYPESLREIGSRAFMQTNLESITIYPGIAMGSYVYDGCKRLQRVCIQEGVTEVSPAVLYGTENCQTVQLSSTSKVIKHRAFDRCGATSIRLPEGLETIETEAFENAGLTSVELPSTLTKLGERAFYSCNDLKSIEFADHAQLTAIGAYAFNHCTELTDVELLDSITLLEDGCFSSCFRLQEIQLPDSITKLGDAVFAGSRLKHVILPDSIQEMGSYVFRDCSFLDGGLESVKMPVGLRILGNRTFEGCVWLTSVEFPEEILLAALPEDTFHGCIRLGHLYLPKRLAGVFAHNEEVRQGVLTYIHKDLESAAANKNEAWTKGMAGRLIG